jgi:3-hydroxyacyl-[acyl-carrier-protein] dehydratase
MRFHLIDNIDSWESSRKISARKVTSAAEDYWRRDQAGRLLMPPGLILETVCQSATWLIMLSSQCDKRAVLLSVDEVVWAGEVVPGDVLTITTTIESITTDAAVVDGFVNVDGRSVLRTAGIMCALLDAETLDSKESSERMARQLLRTKDARCPDV